MILECKELSNTTSWWAHGTSARAGVGITIQNAFLQKFGTAPLEWSILGPGRLAVLNLRGPAGQLELVVGYLATGTRRGLEVDPYPIEQALSLRRQREAATRKLGHLGLGLFVAGGRRC